MAPINAPCCNEFPTYFRDAYPLIGVHALARMLDCSETTIRRDDLAGLIPRSVGRRKKWRLAEIVAWVEAGCPKRRDWDVMRKPARLAKTG